MYSKKHADFASFERKEFAPRKYAQRKRVKVEKNVNGLKVLRRDDLNIHDVLAIPGHRKLSTARGCVCRHGEFILKVAVGERDRQRCARLAVPSEDGQRQRFSELVRKEKNLEERRASSSAEHQPLSQTALVFQTFVFFGVGHAEVWPGPLVVRLKRHGRDGLRL